MQGYHASWAWEIVLLTSGHCKVCVAMEDSWGTSSALTRSRKSPPGCDEEILTNATELDKVVNSEAQDE